jgi:hypothetical protein
MPLLDSRYDEHKVWRPRGTPYAEAKKRYNFQTGTCSSADAIMMGLALEDAVRNFQEEFGRLPARQRMIIEVVSSSTSITATVYELPEDKT